MRRILPAVLVVLLVGCEGRVSAPTPIQLPLPPTAPGVTRQISFSGSLAFGPVDIGARASLTIRVENRGNDTLTISAITIPVGFRVDWETGTIPAMSGADLTVTFSPEDARIYSGLLVVSGNVTGGDNRVGVTGTGRTP